jgi:hypothetical protein
MCADIDLKLCTWIYIHDIQIKVKEGCYRLIIGRVMSLKLAILKDFTVFRTFFHNVCSIELKLCTWLLYLWLTDQGQRRLLSTNYWKSYVLEISHFKGFYSFSDFFHNVCSYSFETLYMVLHLWRTDQGKRCLLSTNYWKSYAPWT